MRRYRGDEGVEGVVIAEGRPLDSRLELPSRVRGGAPAAITFSAFFECHRTIFGENKMQCFCLIEQHY